MRLLLAITFFTLLFSGCGEGDKTAKTPKGEPKKENQQTEPVDLGDNTAPVEVRALHGAKEVKKRIDTQRQEDRQVVEEANQ